MALFVMFNKSINFIFQTSFQIKRLISGMDTKLYKISVQYLKNMPAIQKNKGRDMGCEYNNSTVVTKEWIAMTTSKLVSTVAPPLAG